MIEEIQKLTMDDIEGLSKQEREDLLTRYRCWQKEQRREDREKQRKAVVKEQNLKSKDYQKQWKLQNKRMMVETAKKRVLRLKHLGLCTKCGGYKERVNSDRCGACKKKNREYKKNLNRTRKGYYDNRKKQGLCPLCGLSTTPEFITCEPCRKRESEKTKKTIKRRRENKLCPCCGKQREELQYVHCKRCRAHLAKKCKRRTKMRFEKGLCTRCGKKKEDLNFMTCQKCRTELRHRNT